MPYSLKDHCQDISFYLVYQRILIQVLKSENKNSFTNLPENIILVKFHVK